MLLGLIKFLSLVGVTFYIFLCPVFVLSLVYAIKMVSKEGNNGAWEIKGLLILCIISLILLLSPVMYDFVRG